MSRVQPLIDFLHAEMQRGETHHLIDDGARNVLREWFLKARERKKTPANKIIKPNLEAQKLEPVVLPQPRQVIERLASHSKQDRWLHLKQLSSPLQAAQALGSFREQVAWATGSLDARLMFVGDVPTVHDEKSGLAFDGVVGQKLNDIIKAMGLAAEDCYRTHYVKMRPAMPRQTTNNRRPTTAELSVWKAVLDEEIDIVKPDCIIAMGAVAALALLGVSDDVMAQRQRWHEYQTIPLRVTFHPSTLLRQDSMELKRNLWEDMLAIMEHLKLPISEKQRGYFLPKTL